MNSKLTLILDQLNPALNNRAQQFRNEKMTCVTNGKFVPQENVYPGPRGFSRRGEENLW